MSKSSDVYEILSSVRHLIHTASQEENVSELLLWLLIRQQADYELILQEQQTDDNLCGPGLTEPG